MGSAQFPKTKSVPDIGALVIRIRSWGTLYYTNTKEPHNSIGNYLGPYITTPMPGTLSRISVGLCRLGAEGSGI